MILVDFSQLAIGSIMAELQGRTDVIINVPMVRHMLLNSLRAYNVKFRKEYGELIICCDSRNYWRKRIFPNYKIGRKAARASSGLDWTNIYEGINHLKQELEEIFPYPVVEINGAEGDDVIASLVIYSQTHNLTEGNALMEGKPKPVIILSGDGDFKQLQKYENVKQYDPIRKKDIIIEESADRVLMDKMLYGCDSDCVPRFINDDDAHVKGTRAGTIMKTKAAEWKGMTMEAIAADPYLKDYAAGYVLKNLQRNKALVDLHEIPGDIQEQIVENYLSQRGVRNRSKLMNYFIKHGLNTLVEKMGDF
jgi:hypothetical protein